MPPEHEEKDETFPATEPPSVPNGPIAIRKLVEEVHALRNEIATRFDRLDNLVQRFDRIETSIASLVANYKMLAHDFAAVKRGHVDHEERITTLELRQHRKAVGKVVKARKK